MKRIEGGVLVLALTLAAGAAGQNAGSPAKGAPGPNAAPDAGSLTVEFANQIPPVDRQNLQSYRAGVESRTKGEWLRRLPAIAKPPQSPQGAVGITCWVHTDGRVTGMMLEQPSGKVVLDRAAWAAIVSSSPYDAFPYGIAVDQVKMRFTFTYNGGTGNGETPGTNRPR